MRRLRQRNYARRCLMIDAGLEWDAIYKMWHVWYGANERWFASRYTAERWLAAQKKTAPRAVSTREPVARVTPPPLVYR